MCRSPHRLRVCSGNGLLSHLCLRSLVLAVCRLRADLTQPFGKAVEKTKRSVSVTFFPCAF